MVGSGLIQMTQARKQDWWRLLLAWERRIDHKTWKTCWQVDEQCVHRAFMGVRVLPPYWAVRVSIVFQVLRQYVRNRMELETS